MKCVGNCFNRVFRFLFMDIFLVPVFRKLDEQTKNVFFLWGGGSLVFFSGSGRIISKTELFFLQRMSAFSCVFGYGDFVNGNFG